MVIQKQCDHPASQNWNSLDPGNGCNSLGTIDPFDYSCCEFHGCGAVDTQPPANEASITTFEAVTDPHGNNHEPIPINEQYGYWVDSGTCVFAGCT